MLPAVVFAAAIPSGFAELVPSLWMGQTALAGIASGAPCTVSVFIVCCARHSCMLSKSCIQSTVLDALA